MTITLFYAIFQTFVGAIREDKYKGNVLTASLPVTREQIVRAKLVYSWLCGISIVLCSCLFQLILSFIYPNAQPYLMEPLGRKQIVISVFIFSGAICALLPLGVRFSAVGGIIILNIAALLLTFAFWQIPIMYTAYFFFSNLLHGVWLSFYQFKDYVSAVGIGGGIALTVFMYYLSYLLAVAWFKISDLG
jgi:hypothetical protein